jgi:hypothetical protein
VRPAGEDVVARNATKPTEEWDRPGMYNVVATGN